MIMMRMTKAPKLKFLHLYDLVVNCSVANYVSSIVIV